MILAEELDADFAQVVLEHAPPNDKLYGNPSFGIQVTGNSNSIRAFWKPLRKAGAGARAMLVQAAAQQWQVEPASCTASERRGACTPPAAASWPTARWSDAAAALTPPKDVAAQGPEGFHADRQAAEAPRHAGQGQRQGRLRHRRDAARHEVRDAGAHARCSAARSARSTTARPRTIPGVRQVVVLDDLVAVVGDHMWAAKKGLEALDITWDEGPNAARQLEATSGRSCARRAQKDGAVAKTDGDIAKGLADGRQARGGLRAAVPRARDDGADELHGARQARLAARSGPARRSWRGCSRTAAKAAGLPLEKVTVHNHLLGGGFGRRLEPDMVVAAVRIAKQVDGPGEGGVDARRGHPARHLSPGLSRHDLGDACRTARSSAGNTASPARRSSRAGCRRPSRTASTSTRSIAPSTCPTTFPNFQVEYVRAEPPAVPTGFWRGVGPNNNVFAIECFMDELARKAGKDPVAFRRDMLGKNAAPAGRARSRGGEIRLGPAAAARASAAASSVQPSFGSFIATVVEAEVDEQGEVRLRRVTSAVDTGIAVNPDTIVAQLQGGLIFGLTAALYGEITIDKGRVQQSNFNDYRMLRIDEVPQIEVHVIKSGEAPGGIGETGATAGPPALAQRDLCRDRQSPCAGCPSTATCSPGGKGMRPAVRKTLLGRRRDRGGGGRRRPLDPARARARMAFRRRPESGAGGLSRRRSHRRPGGACQGEPRRARRISGARGGLHGLPYRARRQGICRRPGVQAALRHAVLDQHHAGQGDRHRQLQRSRSFSTPCIAASRRDGARLYPAMPFHVLHLHDRCAMRWRSRPICSAWRRCARRRRRTR